MRASRLRMARIVSTGVSGLSPEIMGLGPIEATKKALALAGKSISDIDLFEINEAFACVAMFAMHDLGIPHEKVMRSIELLGTDAHELDGDIGHASQDDIDAMFN